MKIIETEYYTDLKSVDSNGEFTIRFQNDCSQITLEDEYSNIFIDINKNDLIIIKNCIDKLINNYENNKRMARNA